MGYFRKPIRRSTARKARLAHLEAAREIPTAGWKRCGRSIRPASDSYLRFVIDHPRVERVGLFWEIHLIADDEAMSAPERSHLKSIFRWFNRHMRVPRRLPSSAVCWFRADAVNCIDRIRELVEVYRSLGYPVWMQATRTPGRIVYRDDHQVAAIQARDRRPSSSAA